MGYRDETFDFREKFSNVELLVQKETKKIRHWRVLTQGSTRRFDENRTENVRIAQSGKRA